MAWDVNTAKLRIAGLVIVCASVLFGIGRMSDTVFVALVGPIVGYIVGNGVAGKQGITVEPIVKPKQPAEPLAAEGE